MGSYLSAEAFTALLQVIMIDLVLAGDNAIVIGLAAAGLPKEQRAKVIFWGIAAATVMRIGFAGITVQLLQIIGLLLAGGLLLLWVCWKMWRELRALHPAEQLVDANTGRPIDIGGIDDRRGRPSDRRSGRSSSPTYRCRSITCSRSRAHRVTIPTS